LSAASRHFASAPAPAFGDRILKLARTIADLAGSDRTPALRRTQCGASVQTAHIAEAIQYRPRRME